MSKPLLFNIDCNCMLHLVFPPERRGRPFVIETITDYIDLLAASGVDTVVMNANAQPPWYPSKRVKPVYHGYTRGDVDFVRGMFPPLDETFTEERFRERAALTMGMLDACLDLEEAGIDWFAAVAERCRHHGMRPWASIRMNDAHGGNSWETCFMNCELQRDPRFRLTGLGYNADNAHQHYYQLLDYRHPEVRQYYLDMIADALLDHDYEGLELDWLRMPLCCNPPAGAEDHAIMLDFFTRVRELADRKAAELGRPVPVSVRAPIRLGFVKAIGLDLADLARSGLIDAIAVSNFWQTSWDVDYAAIRAQLPAETQLIGVIEDAPNWLTARNPDAGRESHRLLSTTAALVRGNAANKLVSGCDAIETYNYFSSDAYHGSRNPDSSCRQADYGALQRLTDLAFLAGQPLHYTLQTMYGPFDFPLFEYADQLPVTVAAGHKHGFRLPMVAQPDSHLTIDIVTESAAKLGLSVNQRWPLFGGEPTEELPMPIGQFGRYVNPALRFELAGSALRTGENEILVINSDDEPVTILSVEIVTRPRQ